MSKFDGKINRKISLPFYRATVTDGRRDDANHSLPLFSQERRKKNVSHFFRGFQNQRPLDCVFGQQVKWKRSPAGPSVFKSSTRRMFHRSVIHFSSLKSSGNTQTGIRGACGSFACSQRSSTPSSRSQLIPDKLYRFPSGPLSLLASANPNDFLRIRVQYLENPSWINFARIQFPRAIQDHCARRNSLHKFSPQRRERT